METHVALSPLTSPVLAGDASDTVTPAARKALIGSAVGYAMDGFDLLILSFMLRAVAAGLGIPLAQAASLATATLIGAVLGGLVFGVLSDRLGRVRVLTWTIVIFAVFTGLCALAPGYWSLLAFRTLAGVGLGGEFGIGMGTRGRSLAGLQACPRLVLCRAGLAGGRAGGRGRHADPAAADRLARHVRDRRAAGGRRLLHPARPG
jgi:MFS family permease